MYTKKLHNIHWNPKFFILLWNKAAKYVSFQKTRVVEFVNIRYCFAPTSQTPPSNHNFLRLKAKYDIPIWFVCLSPLFFSVTIVNRKIYLFFVVIFPILFEICSYAISQPNYDYIIIHSLENYVVVSFSILVLLASEYLQLLLLLLWTRC